MLNVDLTRDSGIYVIENTQNGKNYVGQAYDLLERHYSHTDMLHRGRDSRHLQRAWLKYGDRAFRIRVLCKCPIFCLNALEGYWIETLKSWDRASGYNILRLPNGRTEYPQEVRAKISKALTGRKLSEETKLRISQALKGRQFSTETRQRISENTRGKPKTYTSESRARLVESRKRPMSNAQKATIAATLKGRPSPMKGRKASDETKAKQSLARTGTKRSEETKKRMKAAIQRNLQAKTCAVCGTTYQGRDSQRYCSSRCKDQTRRNPTMGK
jgi:group I intron endonuclease